MKICFIPIDNRPVCYNLPKDIVAMDSSVELFIPPREYLGDLKKNADIENILNWLENIPKCDSIILSLDTIAYGGLIPSRRSEETFEEIKFRVEKLKQILECKKAKIYAFSSIMRISNNNYNEEEKPYWDKYGKKIFDYSYYTHKNGGKYGVESCVANLIPNDILNDYLDTRKRNFEINKIYLEWQKEGFFETLIFSKDDCAEYGFNVMEAQELENLGGFTKTGADEIPLSLLARSIEKKIKIAVEYTESDYVSAISNYEDVSIEKSVLGQIELAGFEISAIDDADIILIVNNFVEKQGEHVMGWETVPYNKELILPDKYFAVADVRYANGADNNFVEQLLKKIDLKNFMGYSAWNTSANTLGSLLASVKLSFGANNFDEKAFKKLQMIRFLDDWAYQANVRAQIDSPQDISNLMKPFEERLNLIFDYLKGTCPKYIYPQYIYPWNRKFEIEVNIN